MILGIDPANEYSAFVVVENDLSAVVDKGKIPNKELQDKISNWKAENYPIRSEEHTSELQSLV